MKRLIFALFIVLIAVSVSAQDLYRARADGHVDSVYMGIDLPEAYTGEGVIIGVTDWGFDFTHPVFYDSTMTRYRILRAWDQFRTGGPAPAGFDYGTELVGQEQLLAAACDTSNIYGHHYHGTHVASIAGGSGAGTAYRGVAPDAEFIFVAFRAEEQAVVDAFQWMYEVAQQEQKRLVVNMSWGIYWMDNFEGTGVIGQKMRELSDLGVVFVTSGGNNGDAKFHLGHTFNNDTLRSRFMFPVDNGSADYWGTSISMTNSPCLLLGSPSRSVSTGATTITRPSRPRRFSTRPTATTTRRVSSSAAPILYFIIYSWYRAMRAVAPTHACGLNATSPTTTGVWASRWPPRVVTSMPGMSPNLLPVWVTGVATGWE